MRHRFQTHLVRWTVLWIVALAGLPVGSLRADENSKYLDAVREFADNVLKYGRDTYGPKHTPLFVDGLNIHTHEPVKWIAPNGDKWILSNLASQQNLFRTLDGLTTITGNPKYKQAAMDAIKYAFDNLRSPNGLLYWGVAYAYDAERDAECSTAYNHSLRWNFPYYELMWEVSPMDTSDYITSFWASHILDWSSLDFLRYASLNKLQPSKGWEHEYKGGSVFSAGEGDCTLIAGSSLFYAAAMLSKLSGEKEPFIWSKRLVYRYVETRNPTTGIASFQYHDNYKAVRYQLSDIIESRSIPFPDLFPVMPNVICGSMKHPSTWTHIIRGWICVFLLSELLGPEGDDFKRWALEELTAWGKSAYRKEDNAFIPMFTNGISLEGYVLKKDGALGAKGTSYQAWHPQTVDLWGYALAYRLTENEFMWEMVRNIAKGNNFGDIGSTVDNRPELENNTLCSDPYALLGFLELYRKTGKVEFLEIASRVGDNILNYRLHKGFFVLSKRHIYARFDEICHLSLLHLFAAVESKIESVPWVWPNEAVFGWDYRQRDNVFDVEVIYTLTDYLEPPLSLHEAAAIGNLELVKLFLLEGADVNSRERPMWTPLHRAVINGHKNVVALLLTNGANVDARNSWPGNTALFFSAVGGHKHIAMQLIEKGADVNAKNPYGDTPLQYAAYADNKDIIELLLRKGATIANLHIASYMGDLEKAEAFINKGADINALDGHGYAPLHYAAQNKQKEIIELLTVKGADVNVKNWQGQTPLDIAVSRGHKDIVQLLLSKGAEGSIHTASNIGDVEKVKAFLEQGTDVNVKDARNMNALHYAAREGHKEVVELLLENGADVNAGAYYKRTAAEFAMRQKHKEIVELLISKGADISPLHLAISMEDETRARSLIEAGADVNKRTPYGNTPLSLAISAGLNDLVGLLIDKDADVNVRDNWDWTPLHGAVSKSKDMVELLIANGANVNAKDGNARIPLWYAEEGGHTEIAEILRKHGAKE